MWFDEKKKHYFWIAIEDEVNRLGEDLVKVEEIEECDRYIFSLHMNDVQDLNVFNAVEREEILDVLSVLIDDAKKHCRTLSRVMKTIEHYKKAMRST